VKEKRKTKTPEPAGNTCLESRNFGTALDTEFLAFEELVAALNLQNATDNAHAG